MGSRMMIKKRTSTASKITNFKKAKMQVGDPKGSGLVSKSRTTLAAITQSQPSRTLLTQDVTTIPYGSAENERERNKLLLKGFRLRGFFRNNLGPPTVVRVALVAPRQGTVASTTNFFKGFDGERGLDFSTLRDGLQMTSNGINDDVFAIIYQTRIELGATSATSTTFANNMPSIGYLNAWVPLERQLTYDSSADNVPDSDRVFLVWWMDDPYAANGAATTASTFLYSMSCVTYYKDT